MWEGYKSNTPGIFFKFYKIQTVSFLITSDDSIFSDLLSSVVAAC